MEKHSGIHIEQPCPMGQRQIQSTGTAYGFVDIKHIFYSEDVL